MSARPLAALEVWKAAFPFRMTFSHNLASRCEAETLLVLLEDAQGRCGYGQVLPRGYLTGESLESEGRAAEAHAAYRRALWAFRYHRHLTGEEPFLLDEAVDGAERTGRR